MQPTSAVERHVAFPSDHRARRAWLLLAILSLALAVRVSPATVHFVIGTDEALYLTLAQHLAAGDGFTADGVHPHSEFDPGYPLLAAAIHQLTGTDKLVTPRSLAPPSQVEALTWALEFPARANILLMGGLLAAPIYFLARAFEKEDESHTGLAWRAAFLTATMPALALGGPNFEAASEQLYSLALWSGWLFLWLGLERRRWYFSAASGLAFGIAHLTRWEGLVSAGIAFLMLLLSGSSFHTSNLHSYRSLLLFLIGVLLLAGPYALYQTARTGTMFSSKAIIHQLHGEALASPDPFAWEKAYANYERARDNPGLYPPLPIYLWMHRAQTVHNYVRNTVTQARIIFTSPTLMLVVWLPLAVGGARRMTRRQNYLLAATLFPILIFPVSVVDPRYLLPLIPAGMIWSARGVAVADENLRLRLSRILAPWTRKALPGAGWALTGLLCALWVAADLLGPFLIPRPVEYKVLGEWMAANGVGQGEVVLARKRQTPFYAGARWEWLPLTDTAGLLAYAAERGATYVVIDERTVPTLRPELGYLLDPAKAPESLQLVREVTAGGKRALLYRIPRNELPVP